MGKKKDVEVFYDKLAETYNQTHANRFVDEVFEQLLKEYLPRGAYSLLDAGGGIGRFSLPLTKKGARVVLTDISQSMLDMARKRAKENNLSNVIFFKESVTEMIHQKNNSFDVVLLMNGVLDYCEDYNKALSETARVLKTEGIAMGTVNNRFIYTTTNILLEKKDPAVFSSSFTSGNYKNKFNIHDFTLDELKKSLKNNGFNVVEILGPTNLLRKWEYEKVVTKENKNAILQLQLEFSKKLDYLNNSSDFFFVARKG